MRLKQSDRQVKFAIHKQEAGFNVASDGTVIRIHEGYVLRVSAPKYVSAQFHSSVPSAMREVRRLRKRYAIR
jgi:hypothetical protein